MKKMLRSTRKQNAVLEEGGKLCGVAAAIIGSAVVGAGASMYSSSKNASAAQAGTTAQNKLDPRIDSMLFGGSDGNGPQAGLLSRYQGMLDTPQSQGLQDYGKASNDYLSQYGAQDMGSIRNAATGLMAGHQAPMSTAASANAASMGSASASLPAYAVGNQVQAPNQNHIDLTGSYQNLLGGGNTDALMKSLQAGNDLTSAAFEKNQTDVTNNLMRNVMPSIRSNSVLAGQYGGSRQGVAEGNAISDYTNQLTSANTQLGAANSANTSNALAGAYQQGQDRALAATQGLGAQQYATAMQNANTKNAAEFMNVGNMFDASKTNAGLQQQAWQTNAGLTQQANLANAGFNQQTNLANQASQISTNAQNNGTTAVGAGLLGGLGSTAYNGATADQNYDFTRASQVNGLLDPYLSPTGSKTTVQPYYQSTGGNILSGGLMGAQLGSMFMGGGKSSSGSTYGGLLDMFGSGSTLGGNYGGTYG